MGSTYFGSAMPDEEVFEALDAFCALGGSFIDTARAYGEGAAERVIGKWMRARGNREKLVLDEGRRCHQGRSGLHEALPRGRAGAP